MSFLICMVAVCPIRAQPSHRSEQVSQLLFGEIVELLERTNEFVHVRVAYDNYEGWCQLNQIKELELEMLTTEKVLAGDWVNKITVDGQRIYIPFGSSLNFLANGKGIKTGANVEYKGATIHPAANVLTAHLIKNFASTFLNTPYLWGGRSVFGIDCSGFTQLVFQCINIPLMRDAHQQATQGEVVECLEKVQCGDLAFFNNEAGKITHTGILLDANTVIHASGRVRIDSIDASGIINKETGIRTHNLYIIKRVINSRITD